MRADESSAEPVGSKEPQAPPPVAPPVAPSAAFDAVDLRHVQRRERLSERRARDQALEMVGAGWGDVLEKYGNPDHLAAGEWWYAGHDGDAGMCFRFEQGVVKDGEAVDPDWRPRGEDRP